MSECGAYNEIFTDNYMAVKCNGGWTKWHYWLHMRQNNGLTTWDILQRLLQR